MDTDPKKQPTSMRPHLSWFWWLVFIGLIAWNILLLMPKQAPEVDIPYTVMLQQVQSDNVTKVKINGDTITGSFVNPITYQPTDTTPAPTSSVSPSQPTVVANPVQYSTFRTFFPSSVGDPNLIPLLQAHNVQIDVAPQSSPWVAILLTNGLPILLLVLVMVWMGRSAAQSQSGIFNFARSKAREYAKDYPKVTFGDVAGADEAKEEMKEIVDFLRYPQKYHKLGARIPRGILLVGSPGTGKTLMARAVAGEAGVPFFILSASEFVEMFVGVGASRVRDLFEKAKHSSPAIVFIDELDAIGRRRGAGLGAVNDEREQTLNQLLVEMDGFDEHHELIILAATNRPDVLDPALLRPGRFDREIVVGLPDRNGREGILRIHTRNLNLDTDVQLDLLSRTTTGFSGADLANLCNEAALVAARENHDRVRMIDFEEALDRVLLGAARTLLLNDHDRQVVAYHEAGHALVAWLSPLADPVHKVTIIPRGKALGVTEQMPGEDQYNYSKEYLLARLGVMLGGRASEEIALDDITTGAENDLQEATRLTRRMITRWGMGSLGLMVLSSEETQPFLGYELAQGRDFSEETASRIDLNIQQLLDAQYQRVKELLQANREKLDNLVKVLLQEETVDEETIEKIIGTRAVSTPEDHNRVVEVISD